MSELSLEAQANQLGIPMKIVIDDGIRQEGCDAHAADLVSIEGKHAIYEGECNVGHHYEQKFLIEDIKQSMSILNGEYVLGGDKGFDGGELEEY